MISIYVPLQSSQEQVQALPPDQALANNGLKTPELKKISMAEAKKVILDILNKEPTAKTSGKIKDQMNLQNYDINKHSLKAVLTGMKEEGLIEKDPEQGGWVICKTKQHKPLKKV